MVGGKSLGDVALSMQVALPANDADDVAAAAHRPEAVEATIRRRFRRRCSGRGSGCCRCFTLLTLENYVGDAGAAALLVWSSIQVSELIAPKDPFWDFDDATLLGQVVNGQATVSSLTAWLTALEQVLLEAGNKNAKFFSPQNVMTFTKQAATDQMGVLLLRSLLIAERELLKGAAAALKDASGFSTQADSKASDAMRTLAEFAASLTATFNSNANSLYSGVSGRVLGPMLFLEASGALGAAGVSSSAMLSIYGLKQGHGFDLGTFVGGALPGRADVAVTQTVVSVG